MEKIWGTLVVGIAGALLVAARRYKNKDKEAGYTIAGWSMVIILSIWGMEILESFIKLDNILD